MKPVVVITVFRRYHELLSNLKVVRELSGEFSEPPDVVVVWARPELGRVKFFDRLVRDGLVTKVISRPPLPGEGGATSYPESHNIRAGLEWVRDHYPAGSAYALVMAADVRPNPEHGFKFVDSAMTAGNSAVVLHWENGSVVHGIWHTNFFAVRLDEAYWPPLARPGDGDTLEFAWGKRLRARALPGVVESHNSRGRRFAHDHVSESLPPFPVEGLDCAAGCPLYISCEPWWRRGVFRFVSRFLFRGRRGG